MTEVIDVILLGFTIPDDMFGEIAAQDASMPTQTHLFAWHFVEALGFAGARTVLLSAVPVSNYPRFPHAVIRGRSFTIDGERCQTLSFVNMVAVKHISRFLSCLSKGRAMIHQRRPNLLLVHGVHSPFLLFATLARKAHGIPTVVIITDPPGVVVSGDRRAVRLLKRIDARLVQSMLGVCDGVVVVTPQLARRLAPGKPSLVMDGMVDRQRSKVDNGGTQTSRPDNGHIHIGYAGGLSTSNGVDLLVRAVMDLSPKAVLETYGKGDLADWIGEMSLRDPHVRRPEFLSPKEVMSRYQRLDLLVQPRPVGLITDGVSFPSKLLEYMSSGIPVLSTRLQGIPSEFEPYIYWIDDPSVGGIRSALAEVCRLPAAERREKGERAARFVGATRSTEAQGAALRAFLRREILPPGPFLNQSPSPASG